MGTSTLTRPDLALTSFHGMVTAAPVMLEFFAVLKRVARTDASVLLRGATGTGKELVASAIHHLSRRAEHRFEAVNCATLSPELLASELFGHVKGAFTGAIRDKKGLFLLADKGSIFLDEVAEMPLDIQARFLRVLQDKTFTPVGSVTPVKVDLRIISATHKSLREQVERGFFREDLMYRIRVVPLFLPRLIDRPGDIEALTWHFVDLENRKGLRQVREIERSVFDAFLSYSWPGNVRELRNNIELAFAVGEGPVLRRRDLAPEIQGELPAAVIGRRGGVGVINLRQMERTRLLLALEKSAGRKGVAAKELGMSRSTLWRKMREHGIIGDEAKPCRQREM